jgi:RHS repeat-associated protein
MERANGKPHALTSISGVPSQFPTDSLEVTYTDFKKIKTLTEGNKTYTLSYGIGEQRKKSVFALNGSTQMTRYYSSNYEEEISPTGNIRKIHYLPGAVFIQNNGNDSLLFLHGDHLGSLVALSDYSGNVLERYAYDPWGNRRNPNDWTQKDTRSSWRLNRGFTMHEHLDQFGIINMNGRVYDPLTAQFFSPDPYLQAPGFSQSYNRYAYCFNNPLIYTDPDGEWALIDDLIAAVVGGIVNVVVNAIQGNIHSWGQGFSYFGVGAAGTWAGLYAGPLVSGGIIGSGNNFVTQGFGGTGNWSWKNIDYGQVGMSGLMGLGMSYLGGQVSGLISPHVSSLTSGIGGQAVQQALTQGVVGSGTGFVLGTGAALLNGDSFGDALKVGGQGAALGAVTGSISGLASGMRSAYKAGENPWTGNPKTTTVYRVASEAEYNDIKVSGIRVNPDGTGYQDGKLFYTSYEDALKGQALFQNAYGQTSTIIKVAYPTSIVNNSFLFQADGMNALMINSLNLNKSVSIRYK